MDKLAHDILDTVLAFLVGLVPSALGAAVSLLYEKGLTWGDRFVRLSVGVVVSFFVGRAAGAIMTLDPFVLQSLSFTLGMIAFKATPAFVSNASAVIADLPNAIRDRFLPKKGSGE